MTNEDIAVKLEGHEHEIESLKHRMKKQEEQSSIIQDLAMSVKEWAINSKNMMEEQKKQGERLEKLENKPADRWNTLTKTIITSIVSTVVGALVAVAIMGMAQFIQ